MLVLLYGWTTWTITKRLVEKLDGVCFDQVQEIVRILQNSSCTATYLPSHKPSKYDKQDTLGTDGEVRKNS